MCWVILGGTGGHWAVLGDTGPCWGLLSCAGGYWVVLGDTGPCWSVLVKLAGAKPSPHWGRVPVGDGDVGTFLGPRPHGCSPGTTTSVRPSTHAHPRQRFGTVPPQILWHCSPLNTSTQFLHGAPPSPEPCTPIPIPTPPSPKSTPLPRDPRAPRCPGAPQLSPPLSAGWPQGPRGQLPEGSGGAPAAGGTEMKRGRGHPTGDSGGTAKPQETAAGREATEPGGAAGWHRTDAGTGTGTGNRGRERTCWGGVVWSQNPWG